MTVTKRMVTHFTLCIIQMFRLVQSPSGEVKYSSCFCGQITDTSRDMLAERLNRLMPGGLVLPAANELSTLGDVTDDEN